MTTPYHDLSSTETQQLAVDFDITQRILNHLLPTTTPNEIRTEKGIRVAYSKHWLQRKVEYATVSTEGCHPVEYDNNTPVQWTQASSTFHCLLAVPRKIRWISLRLSAGPIPRMISIHVNDQYAFTIRLKRQRQLRLHLPETIRTADLRIRIASETFVPKYTLHGNNDERELGVQVFDIVCAKYWWRTVIPLVNGRSAPK